MHYNTFDDLGHFFQHGLTSFQAWISNHMPNQMRGEITYPFPNFNGANVWELTGNVTTQWMNYLPTLRIKLKRTHGQPNHSSDVIMGAMASQITSLNIVYSTVYSDADHRTHQSSASRAFVRGIHR